MSEAKTTTSEVAKMPGAIGADEKGEIPSAYDIPLAEILPVSPRLWSENKWQECFERLRAEDPVHFNETETAGRFWSLTRYQDIKDVDSDWQNFSSANGITLGFPVGAELPEGMLNLSTFIAMDPVVRRHIRCVHTIVDDRRIAARDLHGQR